LAVCNTHRQTMQSIISTSELLWLLPTPCSFLAWHTLRHWGWRRHIPPKRRSTSTGLYSVISQKKEIFKQYKICSKQ
jgi:hypothetical protein